MAYLNTFKTVELQCRLTNQQTKFAHILRFYGESFMFFLNIIYCTVIELLTSGKYGTTGQNGNLNVSDKKL